MAQEPSPLTAIARDEGGTMVRYDDQDGLQMVVRDECEVR